MRNSLLNNGPAVGSKVLRSSLGMYDVYSVTKGGDKYMHTGWRTRPPSGGNTDVCLYVNGRAVHRTNEAHNSTLFTTREGKEVLGFQAVRLTGSPAAGEDGAVVSFKDKHVYYLGQAAVSFDG